jgi:hypothetical protein
MKTINNEIFTERRLGKKFVSEMYYCGFKSKTLTFMKRNNNGDYNGKCNNRWERYTKFDYK